MNHITSYPKILTLGSSMTENALLGKVYIQEKVDGSLFGFGKTEDGTLSMRSKSVVFRDGEREVDKMFIEPANYIKSIMHVLDTYDPDTYFYSEYLSKPKHNTLKYENKPKNGLVLFDAMVNGRWMTREELETAATKLGIDVIPQLYYGDADVAKIKELLETKSYLGGETVEGVVIKNYVEKMVFRGSVFPMFTKYVREAFKERHATEWKVKTVKGGVDQYIESFKSEARWQKALLHLKEKDQITQSPKDIGPLMKEVSQDITEEEEQNIKEFLWKQYRDQILRTAVRGLPEWYKNKLLENVGETHVESNKPS